MFKAIFFDIDGVLIDSLVANHKFFEALLKEYGLEIPTLKDYEKFYNLSMKEFIELVAKNETEEKIETIYQEGKNNVKIYPLDLIKAPDELEETVKILSAEYKLGIVTGRIRAGVFNIPQLKKIEKYFSVVVSYDDTTAHKPDPEPLLLAAKKLGLEPRDCVYVGDMPTDIEAARAAGVKSIFYSKEKYDQADAQALSFAELPEVIKKLT